ncbi:MAG: LapA family protein [Rhodoferax sp.]|nr:LapA family protein [Rhodoferax sp.]
MKNLFWLLKGILKAAIFFTLFAFALNNEQPVTVHFFFGNQWQAPLVLVVLLTFSIGVAVGVLGMVPWRLKQHRLQQQAELSPSREAMQPNVVATAPTQPAYSDGL